MVRHLVDSFQALAFELFSSKARHLVSDQEGASSSLTLCILTEFPLQFLCLVEHMYFSDKKSITDEI